MRRWSWRAFSALGFAAWISSIEALIRSRREAEDARQERRRASALFEQAQTTAEKAVRDLDDARAMMGEQSP
jgi:hypothetical protein